MNKQIIYSLLFALFALVQIDSLSGQQDEPIPEIVRQAEEQKDSLALIAKQEELYIKQQEFEIIRLEAEIDALQRNSATLVNYESFFGYNFFNPEVVGQAEAADNLPVPAGYILGPGDNVMVTLWGDSKLQTSITIDREGRFFASEIDKWFYLSGRTVEEAEQYLRQEFQEAYATLNGPKPTTFMDVSLGTLKSLTVQIVGEVNSPGVYTVPPFSTVGSSLLSANGIKISGSLRDVQVLRKGETVNSIDYYKLFLEGQSDTDFRILNGDVIFVPIRTSTVEIDGEVSRPGIYELLTGEYIDQLISYAGGLKPTASSVVQLRRITEMSRRKSDDDAINIQYLDAAKLNPHEVKDGDSFNIPSVMSVNKQVFISGQVKRPGSYAFHDSLHLTELLTLAGGVNDPDFLRSVNPKKIDITRRNPKSDYSEIVSVALSEVINERGSSNLLLNNHDQVMVYPNLNYLPARTVVLKGAVMMPGVYPILKDDETVESIIDRAGGLTSRASPEGIELLRFKKEISILLQQPNNYRKHRVVLEKKGINKVNDGDEITVPEKSSVVEVKGAIYNPGLISFIKGRRVGDYIRMAGGLRPEANKNDLIVFYTNGSVRPKRYFFNPKPEPGCTIQVNSRSLATPVEQALAFVQGISNTLTQVLTTYIIVTQIATVFQGNDGD
jgi:protein involved in polysaccharide export with SLBB domain